MYSTSTLIGIAASLIMLIALALVGCAPASALPPTIKTVEVLVPVRCNPDVPPDGPYAYDELIPPFSIFDGVRALLIDRQQRKATDAKLRAGLNACKGTPPNG